MDGDRFAEAADPPQLDVYDAAGLHFDRRQRIASIANRFIQTNGSIQTLLQHGVEVKVIRPQRLLDHQQVELIETDQVVSVPEAVCGVGIAAQTNFRPAVANCFEHLHVQARFALQLDSLVPLGDGRSYFVDQLFQRGLDADGDAASDRFPDAAQQLIERYPS